MITSAQTVSSTRCSTRDSRQELNRAHSRCHAAQTTMIGNASVISVVPARRSSRRLPGKNLRDLAGLPLLSWTIRAARESVYIDELVITTDDPAAASLAAESGARVVERPPDLATDEARSVDAMLHALDAVGDAFEYCVMLQPTSPLRTSQDIDCALELCVTAKAPACTSVTEAKTPPEWLFRLSDSGRLQTTIDGPMPHRRQDAPAAYALNGAVYIAEVPWLRRERTFITGRTVGYVMPSERSIDIDSTLDVKVAELLLQGCPL